MREPTDDPSSPVRIWWEGIMVFRLTRLGLSATASLLAATSAFAQVSPPASPPTGASAGSPVEQNTTASDAGQEEASSADVVVTAQRREERLKDVPITITAISASQIAASGIGGSRELAALTPGVTIQTTGAAAQATVRGIGNTVVGGNSESPVALYVDGVYISSQYAAVFDLSNIESVQVLKGPQGTLFGRNATGGALLVTTTRPADHFTGSITASYARFDDVRVAGYLSGPITDTLRFDIAANYHDDNGFTRDVLRNRRLSTYHETSVRGKLEFAPDDATSVTLIGDYSSLRDNTPITIGPQPGTRPSTPGAFVPAEPYQVALTFDPYGTTKNYGFSLTVRHDFDPFTIKSITAYRHGDVFSTTDQDRVVAAVSRIDQKILQDTLSQEVTIASRGTGRLQWLGGLFYFGDTTPTYTLSNLALVVDARLRTDAYAAFGELTVAVTDRLKLTGGVRYSYEEKADLSRRATGTPLVAFQRTDADSWTPRVSAVFKVNDTSNLYATFSKGFKSGLYAATVFNGLPVSPETINAYEVGYKLADGPLAFNISGFYYDYSDLQVTTRSTNGLQTLLNAANAEIYGVDADFTAAITTGLRLRLAAAYTHSEYKNFVNAPVYTPAAAGGNALTTGDVSGRQLVRTPEFTANAGLRYETALGGGKIDASADYYYNSGFPWTFEGNYRQDDYSLVNATIGFSPAGQNFRIAVFGKNLTDTVYPLGVSVSGLATGPAYARPRTYGALVNFKF